MNSLDDGARNEEIVRTFHRRLWGDADIAVVEEVIAPDAVTHWGDSESNAVEAIRADVERYFAGFTDVSSSIDDLISDGDKVVLRWTTTGSHTGHYGKVPPTGRRITMAGVDVYRLRGGLIVEAWSVWDALAVYQQLGLVDPEVGP
jgi:predicted ester cyclase